MAGRSLGRAMLGTFLAMVGTVLLVSGVLQGVYVPETILGLPGWIVATAVGLALFVLGSTFALFRRSGFDEPAPSIPAHVAFLSKPTPVREILPELAMPAARPAPAPSAPRPSAPRPSAPKPSAPRSAARAPPPAAAPPRASDFSASDPTILHMDEQIRELTRLINKAGVMLATGQLSDQGYARYVEDLKTQRAELEARRVHAEIGQS